MTILPTTLKFRVLPLSVIFFIMFCASVSFSAEISIPAMKAAAGASLEIPVMIDETDNLAGIKLRMTYDAAKITYKSAEKTRHTSPLMHVVNDKKPGVLIVVMAGARGIKGKNFPIITMKFMVNTDVKSACDTRIDIKEVQLMSDQLKNIGYSVKPGILSLSPGKYKSVDKPISSDTKTVPVPVPVPVAAPSDKG